VSQLPNDQAHWVATEFGRYGLARAIAEAVKSQDDFILRVPSLRITFVAKRSVDTVNVTPIMDDNRFGFHAGKTIPLLEALATMKPAADLYNGLPE
jgi:hypothetical protein